MVPSNWEGFNNNVEGDRLVCNNMDSFVYLRVEPTSPPGVDDDDDDVETSVAFTLSPSVRLIVTLAGMAGLMLFKL